MSRGLYLRPAFSVRQPRRRRLRFALVTNEREEPRVSRRWASALAIVGVGSAVAAAGFALGAGSLICQSGEESADDLLVIGVGFLILAVAVAAGSHWLPLSRVIRLVVWVFPVLAAFIVIVSWPYVSEGCPP